MMYAALIVVHFFVCLILILVVLLQTGKGADLAGAFGGGGSQTALGSRGAATVLSKATTIAAIVFMFTSLALALYSSRRTSDVLQNAPAAAPSVPVAPPPVPKSATPAAPGGPATDSGSQPPAENQPAQAPPSTPEQKTP